MESKTTNSNLEYYKNTNFGENENENTSKKMSSPNNHHYALNNYRSSNYTPKSRFYPEYSQFPSVYPYPYPYYNEYELQKQLLYRAENYINSRYPALLKLNQKNEKICEKINENCKFFEIKALTEEDIHKSIKYGVWSSYKNINIKLNDIYNKTKENNGDVYLFFSSMGTERFVGVAKIKEGFDEEKKFDLWTQDNVWIGVFNVEWIFVKDVPFKEFRNIFITMKNGKIQPVCNFFDVEEIPYGPAKIMIDKIDKYQNSNTILEHFEFYDNRQESYENFVNQKNNEDKYKYYKKKYNKK